MAHVIKTTTTSLLAVMMLISCHKSNDAVSPTEWDYENTNWQAEGYTECAGKVESPIDIDDTQAIKGKLPKLTISYQTMPLQVLDNGHTIQVLGDGKNSVTLNGATYTLKQFHFHRGSEHTINGKGQAMELHMVNENEKTGNIIVLGVLMANGQANAMMQQVLSNLPTTKGQPKVVANTVINPTDFLPTDRSYFTYTGSLTTPPCTQGLDWIVYKTPIQISADQEAAFAKVYPKNNRPTQALNNRQVLEQD